MLIGIYADTAGNPGALLASASGTLKAGVNELPVSATALPAGTYWFATDYASTVTVYTGALRPTKYVVRAASLPLPTTFPAPTTISDATRNTYLVLGR